MSMGRYICTVRGVLCAAMLVAVTVLVAGCARAPIALQSRDASALEAARAAVTRGELDIARAAYQSILERDGSDVGKRADRALVLRLLARVEHEAGNYGEAEELLLEALYLVEEGYGKDDARAGWIASELGPLYQSAKRLAEAEYFHRRALELLEPVLEPTDGHLSILLNNLGSVLVAQDRHEEAILFIERAHQLSVEKGSEGLEHPTALFLVNLADTYRQMGRLTDAEQAYRSALAAQRVEVGYRANLIALTCLDGLAEVEAGRGEFETATTLLRAAISIGERILEAGEAYRPGMPLYEHTQKQLHRMNERYREMRALLDGNWV
jgi:tetratricopeptide (TPR) repeat protein